ncbi:MAG: ABC transporter permease [Thermoanaerobaculia bacterium]
MRAIGALWRRELTRFLRQPSRLLAAAATPLLFWIVIGSGLASSFRLPGGSAELDFREYFYPGVVTLVVLFAAIFATISVIEDRREGFLQGVLAAPVAPAAIAAGKVLGGATVAWLQALPFLLLAPLVGIPLGAGTALAAAGVLALVALAMTALGFAFAWWVDSTQGFHAVMNLVLFPMWLLSGAFFPVEGAPGWLAGLMQVDPLTYGLAALRGALYGATVAAGQPVPPGVAGAVLAVWCLAAFAADVAVVALRRNA